MELKKTRCKLFFEKSFDTFHRLLFIYFIYNRGFVSVVVGSDLKWWKINPCDTSSRNNMFQGINRCDTETTTVNEHFYFRLRIFRYVS